MEMSNRAYSLLDVKSVNEEQRIIEGVASTPAVDRVGDIVEPLGAKFALPMPLLWQHDSASPVGHVTFAKPTKDGIPFKAKIATIAEPGRLKDRLDEAWQSVKAGLVRAVSIGFKGIETSVMKDGGLKFIKWEWLELSLVTIPANAEATIQTIKEYDTQQRAATGRSKLHRVVRLDLPGVSGKSQPRRTPEEGNHTMNITENITGLEAKLVATRDKMEAALAKSIEEGRTPDAAEQEDFDTAEQEVGAIEKQLGNLRVLEKHQARTAKPVQGIQSEHSGSAVRGGEHIVVKQQPKLEPGIGYARLVKVKMAARLSGDNPLTMAQRMYGADSEVAGIITKANEVVAGTTISGNWAADLVSSEGAAVAAFLEYLRPAPSSESSVLAVPNLTRLDFLLTICHRDGGRCCLLGWRRQAQAADRIRL
jgi:HK97 family phage prohead protease